MKTMPPTQAEQQLTYMADRFDHWRQTRISRAAPIPQYLWEQAIALTVLVRAQDTFQCATHHHRNRSFLHETCEHFAQHSGLLQKVCVEGLECNKWRAEGFP